MKKITLFMTFFACATMLFVGCSGDNDDNDNPKYSLTATTEGSGSVVMNVGGTVIAADKVKVGDVVTMTATANEGSVFVKWDVATGDLVLEEATDYFLTFTMPAGNVAIQSKFAEGSYKVYVAGEDYEAVPNGFDRWRSCLWVDGVKQILPSDGGATAFSVYVSEGKTYVTGDCYESKRTACLWVNGVKQNLPSDGYARGNSVYVSGNKVYVAGYDHVDEDATIGAACLWVNGVKQTLPSNNSGTQANSIYISGGKVYITGWDYDDATKPIACLWVDGVKQILLSDGHARAYGISVYVSKGKVYVAGTVSDGLKNTACLWVDGVKQILSSNASSSQSVHVSGGKVYVAGHDYDGTKVVPCLWVDGVKQILSSEESYLDAYATAVCVVSGKVYVTGSLEKSSTEIIPCLWVDGEQQILPSSQNANLHSVAVVPVLY